MKLAQKSGVQAIKWVVVAISITETLCASDLLTEALILWNSILTLYNL
jgi:hypothetical protein